MNIDGNLLFTLEDGFDIDSSGTSAVLAPYSVDLGAATARVGPGEEVEVVIQVMEDIVSTGANGTISFQLIADDAETMASAKVVVATAGPFTEAQCVQGFRTTIKVPVHKIGLQFLGMQTVCSVDPDLSGIYASWVRGIADVQTSESDWPAETGR